MSWSDMLKGSLGGALGDSVTSAYPGMVRDALGSEGLQNLLQKLQQSGLGEQVRSWFDSGRENMPVSVEQLRSALGNNYVQQVAEKFGLPVDQVLALLSKTLPQATSIAAGNSEIDPPQAAGETSQ
jgi:uncharacterized protein YidB (DUF937 family)